MNSVLFAIVVFVLFAGAALLALALHPRLPERHRTKETQDAIKIGVGLVVVLSALVISLLISSVKSSFDTATRDLKRFSTQIILLDRTLRAYGAEAEPTRRALEAYAARALAGTWPKDGGAVVVEDRRAEGPLGRRSRRNAPRPSVRHEMIAVDSSFRLLILPTARQRPSPLRQARPRCVTDLGTAGPRRAAVLECPRPPGR